MQEFTRQEARLWDYLRDHAGRVVTFKELEKRFGMQPSHIKVVVGRIRAKRPGLVDGLFSVRGSGYTLSRTGSSQKIVRISTVGQLKQALRMADDTPVTIG